MLLLQADAMNGVYEVTEFDSGIEPIDVKEFIWFCGYLGYNMPTLATALYDEDSIAEIENEFGIKRIPV